MGSEPVSLSQFLNIKPSENEQSSQTSTPKLESDEPIKFSEEDLPAVDMPKFTKPKEQKDEDYVLGKDSAQKEASVWEFFESAFKRGDKPFEETVGKIEDTIALTKEEQEVLHQRVADYEKYKQSLSNEEKDKLDIFNNSFSLKKTTHDKFTTLMKNKDFSKMTKENLTDILQLTDKSNYEQDGVIGSFSQGAVGSCWLLSALRNISSDKENARTLKDSITNNGDGTYTVKFKGLERTLRSNYKLIPQYTRYCLPIMNEVCKISGVEPSGENFQLFNKILLEKDFVPQDEVGKQFAKFINYAKTKYGFIKEQMSERENNVQCALKKFKDGITVTEEELTEGLIKDFEGNSTGVHTYGDKDVRILEIAVKKYREMNRDTLDGGTNREAYQLLLDKSADEYFIDDKKGSKVKEAQIQKCIEMLENTSPNLLSAGSINPTEEERAKTEKDDDSLMLFKSEKLGARGIFKSHAYNIKTINKEEKTITVENPHSPDIPIPLTYDEFFQAFNIVTKLK